MMKGKIAVKFTSKEFMTELLNTLGKRTERLRKDKSWRQSDLAKAVSVRQNYISAIENDTATPSAELMAAIAKALDTTLDFLMLLTDNSERPQDAEPTFISEEAEKAARLIDELLPTERQQALAALEEIRKEHDVRMERRKLFEYMFGLIRDLGGPEYVQQVEREIGHRAPFMADWLTRIPADQLTSDFSKLR